MWTILAVQKCESLVVKYWQMFWNKQSPCTLLHSHEIEASIPPTSNGTFLSNGAIGILFHHSSFSIIICTIGTFSSSDLLVVVVDLLSHVRLFATPWTAAHQTSLSSTTSQTLLKYISTESVILSNQWAGCRGSLPWISSRLYSLQWYN